MRTKGVKNYKLKFNLKLKNFANDEWLDKGNYASLHQISDVINVPYETTKKIYEKASKFKCQMYKIEKIDFSDINNEPNKEH